MKQFTKPQIATLALASIACLISSRAALAADEVDPLLQKQADCISTMTYNEYRQLIDAGLTPDDLVVFKYEDEGVSTLEDSLYVLEKNLQDDAFVDKMARFVAASMKA